MTVVSGVISFIKLTIQEDQYFTDKCLQPELFRYNTGPKCGSWGHHLSWKQNHFSPEKNEKVQLNTPPPPPTAPSIPSKHTFWHSLDIFQSYHGQPSELMVHWHFVSKTFLKVNQPTKLTGKRTLLQNACPRYVADNHWKWLLLVPSRQSTHSYFPYIIPFAQFCDKILQTSDLKIKTNL